jgi:hypothetical protein
MVLAGSSGAWAADDGVWSVSKSSGDVWIATTGAAQRTLSRAGFGMWRHGQK